MAARIQLPASAKRGEVIEIRVLVQHPMETGYRYDDIGKPIPRNVITRLTCTYDGNEVLRADMTQGIAANPYLQFYAVAESSGEVQISWVDDEGVSGSERQLLNVAG
jgi:sulfur-oxidizing protein SoxZ